ncbi:MAG: insulinase family protein [bacterium]|nr:insulinase family protein [bacterium]
MMTLFGENGLRRILTVALLALLVSAPALAGYEDLENEVKEINLDNGLTILLLERHDVPVFSFWTYVNIGGVDEEIGKTGIAHMFEHMAFKGTQELGTFNYKKERKVLEQMDDVYEEIQAEQLKYEFADRELLAELQAEFDALQEEADELVDSNAFSRLVDSVGGVGMNAMTSSDATQYFYSFPSNRLELWAALESDRFINPVLREFYKERNVILEERNMRSESSPQGRLFEEWMCMAYIGHPYGQPTIGHRTDIEAYSRRDALEFYEEHYGARNMVIAVVGDVYYDELRKMAGKYFANIPPGPGPVPVRTVEPVQLGERRVVIEEEAQPLMLIGYHMPDARHPDAAVYDALADILGQGRSSRLNTQLVKNTKQAAFAGGFTGLPGQRYAGLLTLIGVPNQDILIEDLESAIYDVIAEVTPRPNPDYTPEDELTDVTSNTGSSRQSQTDAGDGTLTSGAAGDNSPFIVDRPITQDELDGYKIRARAQFIGGLSGNGGMAGQLCTAHMVYGDWRELFRQLDKINAVTLDDLERVAKETFVKKNRTVGIIATKDDSDR